MMQKSIANILLCNFMLFFLCLQLLRLGSAIIRHSRKSYGTFSIYVKYIWDIWQIIWDCEMHQRLLLSNMRMPLRAKGRSKFFILIDFLWEFNVNKISLSFLFYRNKNFDFQHRVHVPRGDQNSINKLKRKYGDFTKTNFGKTSNISEFDSGLPDLKKKRK